MQAPHGGQPECIQASVAVNMQILTSSHAKPSLGYHIIFCPKYRHQVLEGAIAVELKRILIETCSSKSEYQFLAE